MPILPSLLYLVLSLVGTGITLVHLDAGAGVIKMLPVLLLTVCAWVYSRPRFGSWVVIALAMGAAGDYSLANSERSWFMIGLGAFLVGHVAYSVAFAKDLRWTRGRGIAIATAVLVMAGLLVAIIVRMIGKGEYAIIAGVSAYVVVISVMMALSVLHRSPTMLIAAGGLVFVISDAHIAVNFMLFDTPRLPVLLSGYATYYLAQYLLAAGAIFEARRNITHKMDVQTDAV
jgi:uncharacterized membrane protein YhhN